MPGVGRSVPLPSRKGGWTVQPGSAQGGQTGRPMTVAPWLNAPGSSVSTVLARKGLVGPGSAEGKQDETAPRVASAVAACEFAASVLGAEECAPIAESFSSASLSSLAHTVKFLVESLCVMGAGSGQPALQPLLSGGTPSLMLPEDSQESLARALKHVLSKIYTRVQRLRAYVRLCMATFILSALQRCTTIVGSQAGARLHSLDGGPRSSSITLMGASAALELLLATVRGLRKPLAAHHLRLVKECLLPLHAPNSMVDDLTPVLSLIHRPLVLCELAFIEREPALTPDILRGLLGRYTPQPSPPRTARAGPPPSRPYLPSARPHKQIPPPRPPRERGCTPPLVWEDPHRELCSACAGSRTRGRLVWADSLAATYGTVWLVV